MRFIALSILAALAAVAYAHFDGQVTSVLMTMNGDQGYVYGTDPGNLNIVEGTPTDVSATGNILNTSTSPVNIISVDTYPISNATNVETHFNFGLQFLSTKSDATPIGPLGSNEDPMYGCMSGGVMDVNSQPLFYFLLTNNKAYATVTQYIADVKGPVQVLTWAIPVCNIIEDELRAYTIALRPDIGRIAYRINDVDMVEIPGYCGIDNKFLISGTSTGCNPNWLSGFITEAKIFVFQGQYWMPNIGKGFCQRAQYEMCEENISFAPGSRCQYQTGTTIAPFEYNGTFSYLQVFVMERTNRCDGESSSSEYVPWYRCRPDCCGPKPTPV